MNKERLAKTDGGYSEIEMDKAADKTGDVNQIKGKSIFDSKNNKKKEKILLKI